jgi:argininosuccinate lyase
VGQAILLEASLGFLGIGSYAYDRDADRLRGAYARTNLSSLGGAALAGTSWPLDCQRTCELLGHDAVVVN